MVSVDFYPSWAVLQSHLAAQYTSPQAAGIQSVCRRVAETEKDSQRGVAIAVKEANKLGLDHLRLELRNIYVTCSLVIYEGIICKTFYISAEAGS
jgi:hypothetical protein